MAKAESHMLKHQRTLERLQRTNMGGGLPPSVTLLHDLVKFLNATHTERGLEIQRILHQMLEIEGMAKSIKGIVWPDMSLRKTDPAKFKLLCEIDDKVALLQRELSKFRFAPRAEVAVGGDGGASEWSTWWGSLNEKSDERLRMRPSQAIEMILRLTQIGYLTRLKRCANCGKWLYAKFRHQEFCSVACQQKKFTQTDQWKAHRRVYMREYYRRTYSSPRKVKEGVRRSR